MSFRLSILTLFRSPFKTLVTFLLLFSTTFAFVSRGTEYAATVREIAKAEADYSAVGTVQRSVEDYYDYMYDALGEWADVYESGAYVDRQDRAIAPLTDEVAELLMSSEYIDFGEAFYVAGGLTDESLRNVTEQPLTEVPNYSEWEWYLNEGSFEMDAGFVYAYYYHDLWGGRWSGNPNHYGANVETVLVGDEPGWYRFYQRFYVREQFEAYSWRNTLLPREVNEDLFSRLVNDHYYLLLVREDPITNYREVVPFVDYPIIDLTRIEEEYGVTDWTEILSDPGKYGVPRYNNRFGLPQMTVNEYLEKLYPNFHTQDLVYVPDMDSVHKYHSGKLFISDGRAITNGETGYVCVISQQYAEQNGLSVGDAIKFEISADTMTHSGRVFGRQPPYPYVNYWSSETYGKGGYARYGEMSPLACEQSLTDLGLDTVTQTYEIVGIWSDSDFDLENPYTYSVNTVFVPEATYPWADEVSPRIMPSNFSFTLKHPGDMALIEKELGDELAARGFELSINDEGYASARPSFEFMKLSALIGFVGMGFALLLSLLLITYLFIIRKKHDYAIMRALGTPVPRANGSLLVSLFTLAIAAVVLGSVLALIFTRDFGATLSAQLSEITGIETVTSIPEWYPGAFGAGILVLLLIFSRIGLSKIGKTPPLRLLQGR